MDNFISPKFNYNGFTPAGIANGFYVFRRTIEGRIQTVNATLKDMETGYIYKMIDAGLSRY